MHTSAPDCNLLQKQNVLNIIYIGLSTKGILYIVKTQCQVKRVLLYQNQYHIHNKIGIRIRIILGGRLEHWIWDGLHGFLCESYTEAIQLFNSAFTRYNLDAPNVLYSMCLPLRNATRHSSATRMRWACCICVALFCTCELCFICFSVCLRRTSLGLALCCWCPVYVSIGEYLWA